MNTHNLEVLRAFAGAFFPDLPPVPPAKKSGGMDMADVFDSAEENAIYQRNYEAAMLATGDPLKAALAGIGAVRRARMGMAVKSTAKNGVVTVKGWGILFSDPAHLDRQETYFSAKTEYFLEDYPRAPLWLEHGEDDNLVALKLGNRSAAKKYPEFGIWVEHELDPSLPAYDTLPFDGLVQDIEQGLYSYSSDSLTHYMVKGYNPTDGELRIWPLAGFSLTRRPAEPGLGQIIIDNLQQTA